LLLDGIGNGDRLTVIYRLSKAPKWCIDKCSI